MNRRLVLGVLALFLVATSGCSGKESTTENTPATGQEVTSEQTAGEATQSDETEAPASGAKAEQVEKENGMIEYRMEGEFVTEYDGSTLEAKAISDSHIFQKKSKDETEQNVSNVFVSITKMQAGIKEEMIEAMQSNPEDKYENTDVTVGVNKEKATKLAKKNADGIHEYYLVDKADKTWLIEVKCEKSAKKKYEKKLNAVISAIDFE